ncbi:ABC1 kinase family protein [Thiohalomonas denitrificans]|uniref:ABC1 kinase family protein n=1 Tax=Thiohalomonas denitrificans TaxID=415747 RepID=UPI0026ED2942|nr:AarF/UbiB family protein [Thiohalomonas denitrificans]
MSRSIQILATVTLLALRLGTGHLLGRRSLDKEAEWVGATLEHLGGSFIKMGQMLGIRADLLPEPYLERLRQLQDRVPPFPAAEAERSVRQSLGALESRFEHFEPEPFAAASIAQVHRARTRDGAEVIVKVRRPGIPGQVTSDLRLLRRLVRLATWLAPGLRRYRPRELVAELERNLLHELDFRQEARNIRRFVRTLGNLPGIYVPDVVDELYSESVLVQVKSGGRRVDDPAVRPKGHALADNLLEAYLHQFLVLGAFHADPHPGNLFVMDDGRLCFHDFGLVGYLDREQRQGIMAFASALVRLDADWLLDAYLDLGLVGGRLDRAEFRRGLDELLRDYVGLPLKEWSFAEAFMRIVRLGHGHNVRLPHQLLVLMRAIFLLETSLRDLDPDYDLVGALGDHLSAGSSLRSALQHLEPGGERIEAELAALVEQLPAGIARTLRRSRREGFALPLHVRGLDSAAGRLERVGNRLVRALLIVGLFLAASLLMQHSLGPRLVGWPLLALLGYAWGLWLTVGLLVELRRTGERD